MKNLKKLQRTLKIEASGKTIDEAVQNGLAQLNLSEDQVTITVLEQPSKGLFGLIGAKEAKVEIEYVVEEYDEPDSDEAISPDSPATDVPQTAIAFLQDVFRSMDTVVHIDPVVGKDNVVLNLSGDEIGMLIGRRGQTLDALQYLVNIVQNRDTRSHAKIVLDAENFRDRRRQTLEELSDRLARKVVKTGKEVVLEPMPPQERKIIHSALQHHRYVKTYSKGEEPNRRIVIALK